MSDQLKRPAGSDFPAASVMLFCPVRLWEEQISDMLRTHRELAGVAEFVYFDDCEPEASALLRAGAAEHSTFLRLDGLGESAYRDHLWTGANVSRIAAIRNLAILHFNSVNAEASQRGEAGFSHLFIVDADLLLNPATLLALLEAAHRKDAAIVAEVFWSQWPNMKTWLPNCWDFNEYAFDGDHSVLRLAEPGIYQVGGLGACTLIARRALESGLVNYTPIYNRRHFGEDRDFCIRAAVAGFSLWVDTRCTPFHVYRREQLAEARAWRDAGSDPGYFAQRWLTDDWRRSLVEMTVQPAARQPIVAVMLPGEMFGLRWVANWTNVFGELAKRAIVLPFFGYSSNVFITRLCMWQTLLLQRGTEVQPDYILWMDDDNLVSVEHVEQLMAGLDSNSQADFIAGWCWIQPDEDRTSDVRVSAGRLDDKLCCVPFTVEELEAAPENLIPAGYTGFPVVVMRGSMLERMPERPFLPLLSEHFDWGMSGEDTAFCIRAQQAGYRLFVDRRVKVPHLKRQPAEPLGMRSSAVSPVLAAVSADANQMKGA